MGLTPLQTFFSFQSDNMAAPVIPNSSSSSSSSSYSSSSDSDSARHIVKRHDADRRGRRRERSRSRSRSRIRSGTRGRENSVGRESTRSRYRNRSSSHGSNRSDNQSTARRQEPALLEPILLDQETSAETKDITPPRDQDPTLPQSFHLDAERSEELRSWMTSTQKPAEAKQLRENFVPSFGKSSFDLQVPKLAPSMARRLKEVRGGEASKAEAKEKALAASQYKIFDIAKLLLYLWGSAMTEATTNSATSDPLLVSAAESALQLWGHAFHNITVQRRENVRRITDPRFEALLSDPGRFKPRDGGLLFGRTFLKSMVRDASDDQKLRALGQQSGSGFTLHGNFNKRGARPGSSTRGSRLVSPHLFVSPILLPTQIPCVRVRGRVRKFSAFWPSLTADDWVLEAISKGVRIPFIDVPFHNRPNSNMALSSDMKVICDAEVISLLSKGAIDKIPLENSCFVSGIFVIPKSSGGFRPIINLKSLNRFVEHLHFKMEGVTVLRGMVRKGDFFTKIDLQDAYLTFVLTVDLLEKCGFLVNKEKSLGAATQLREFLGLFVDSVSLSLSLLPRKVQHIEKICREAGVATSISLRDIAKILGNLAWAIQAIPFAQGHNRCIQRQFLKESARADGDLSTKIRLDEESISDLVWWTANVERTNGRPLSMLEPDLIIFSDASLSGWGAVLNGVPANGPWTERHRSRHINELELLAAIFALKSFTSLATRVSVRLMLDNVTAVHYVNKLGGAKSEELCRISSEIVACFPRFERLETRSGGVRSPESSLEPKGGSVRVIMEQTAGAVCQLVPTTGRDSGGCVQHRLGGPRSLRVSAILSSSEVSDEDNEGAGTTNVYRAVLAEPTVVSGASRNGVRAGPSSTKRGSSVGHVGPAASTSGVTAVNRLEVVRGQLENSGLSNQGVDLLLDGARDTTSATYQSAWSGWHSWCVREHANPVSPPLGKVLEYLSSLVCKGKPYWTVNVARSMLSSTLVKIDGVDVGKYPLVLKLMKGAYNRKPPAPKYSRYATLCRVSELANISRDSIVIDGIQALFSHTKPRKSQRSSPLQKLKDYITASESFRQRPDSKFLFLGLRSPRRSVGASTLARWIKSVLSDAGVDTSVFSAHSTRGAAASNAANLKVPVESTFIRFYRRPSAGSPVANA
ncbi:hypothetical protein GHT06_008943 [Daphnia sinensis]|uniref:Tyr recombinase domain-containing protein n=1 Tax=Daphnia sinensis TaxID=1820382 RepID=A0AAD5L353_9CRUS|nr:hypothetical protein GHT06_008943 [Daphnia sinensis]